MPLNDYGMLKGRPINRQLASGASPHYQIHIVDDTTHYRIAVNVTSQLAPSELEFLVDSKFDHPVLAELIDKPLGWFLLPSRPGGMALALLFNFPRTNQWVGVFLKFQSQTWHTDDKTGHQIRTETSGPPSDVNVVPNPFVPGGQPTPEMPDGAIRIVSALVNSIESPEVEFVSLLNTTHATISLEGWQIADRDKNKMPLKGSIAAGETLRIQLAPPVFLPNKGGIITVLNDRGLRVDGVAYTKEQARNPGWTIKF